MPLSTPSTIGPKFRDMNLNYLAKRLLGRPTCLMDAGAKLGSKARILNPRDDSRYIKIGADSFINGELCVLPHGGNIVIGQRCYIDEGTRIWSGMSITIEDDVVIGPDVNIFDNISHPLSARKRAVQAKQILTIGHPKEMHGLLLDEPIYIGEGSMIGARSFILRGATIAAKTLIEPGSMITRTLAR